MSSSEKTLQARLAVGPLSIAEAKRIASAIAEALDTAHQQGLVHGDLKSSDITLTASGHVAVLGYGRAPEKGDPRDDILFLGAILRDMLAGSPEVPELLEHVVRKMCAVRPEDRYQLVHEVRTDLEHVEVEALSITETRRGRKLPKTLLAVAVLAVLAMLIWWMLPSPGTLSGGDLSSVAVLPLRNVSQDPMESDYLAAGITEAVIAKLAQVGIRVTPWETAKRYADTDEPIADIARELNVDSVLSGNFQLAGERIVTTFTLVEARSGFVTWAEELEEPFEDLFRMQRRIAMGAASSLKDKLTGEEEQALATPESRSVDAYDLYLQGSHMVQEGTEEATGVALDYFARAVELDPGLEEAHVGLGAVQTARYWFGWGGSRNVESARASYERALELNPANMAARRGLILVNAYSGRSEACLIEGRVAERMGRADDLETLLTRALAYRFGGSLADRSIPLFRRVLEIDPVNAEAHFHLAHAYSFTGNFAEAIDIGDVFVSRFGDDEEINAIVAASYHLLGNHERAREHYERVFDYGLQSSVIYPLIYAGLFFDQMGERDRAEKVWRMGVELVEPRLEAYPDHGDMRTYLATLHALLHDRDALAREELRALETSKHDVFSLFYLAAAHAQLGDHERAADLLRRSVGEGRINPFWKWIFNVFSAVPHESETFQPFLEEYEKEVQRLRETY